jgi:hypothetical protein
MTITRSIGAVPIWYIADQVGRPLGGGYLRTLSSLDHTTVKPVFHDKNGLVPWTYVPIINNLGKTGILFNENGSQGPFWFLVNPAVPEDLYFLEVYDSSGVRIWTVDNYSPGSSGGGGGDTTTALDLENLIVNGEFWRNVSNNTNPPTNIATTTNLIVAPGCHAGLTTTTSTLGAVCGPDIRFIKNSLTATDFITFPYFDLGSDEFSPDVTPVQYFNYTCNSTQVGETTKCIQFPITAKVQNFNGLLVTITVWARSTAGTGTLLLQWFDFYGDGPGASVDIPVPIEPIVLTSLWAKYTITATVPDVTGKTLGGCGNDALFLRFQFPLGVPCSIDITKPSMYLQSTLGPIVPESDFATYDEIDGILNVPRTGDVRPNYSLLVNTPPGWIPLNDTSIGNVGSAIIAGGRANIDTFPLYNLLYNNTIDADAPVSGGRTGSAINDFLALKTLTLPKMSGRALAASGLASAPAGVTTFRLGQSFGEQNHTLNVSEIPAHTHPAFTSGGQFIVDLTPGPINLGTAGTNTARQPTTGIAGGGGPHNNTQSSQFAHFIIKL